MAGDSTAVAIYKLAMESQQYVAAAQAAMQANQGLAASAAPVAAGEEKIDKALRGGEAALDRKIARFDAASRINAKYAKEFADLVKIEEAGIGSAEKRAQALAVVTAAHQKELEALDRVKKANAENAAALGTENAALQSAAAAGDRFAQALLTMDAKQAQLNKDLQAGKIGLAEHARLLNLTQEAYRGSTSAMSAQEAAMRKSGTATGLARYELINLSRQFQDIGVSLAGGQSPFRILIEQGSQIADIFASSKAAFGQVFSSMVAWAARFATSMAGIVTIITTVVAATGALALSWLENQKIIERALAGIGAQSGATAADINRIADAAANTTRLSASTARQAAVEFINTGKIYVGTVQSLVNFTDKFALATGVSAAQGAKNLAEILGGDLVKAMETLNAKWGGLDAKTQEYIQSLIIAKNEQEAIKAIMQVFEKDITKAADAATIWARAWMFVSEQASKFFDMLGREAERRINSLIFVVKAANSVWEGFIGLVSKAADELKKLPSLQPPTLPRRDVSPGRVAAQGLRADQPMQGTFPDPAAALGMDTLNKKIEEFSQRAKRAKEDEDAFAASLRDGHEAAEAIAKRLASYSLEADKVTNAIFPQIDAIKNLTDQYNTLKRALDNTKVREGMSAGQIANAQAAMEAIKLRRMAEEDSLATTKQQNRAVLQVVESQRLLNGEVDEETGERKRLTVATSLQLQNLDAQLKVYQAMKEPFARVGVERAVNEMKVNALILQGKSLYEAQLIVTKEQTLVHLQNMTTLKEQLKIAEARTGIAKINAQYEIDINTRLREGATLSQAIAEATIKRQIAIENVNTSIEQQIFALGQENELIRARQDGDEASVRAAQAYTNALRAGADTLHAMALEAAVLENELEKAAASAGRIGATRALSGGAQYVGDAFGGGRTLGGVGQKIGGISYGLSQTSDPRNAPYFAMLNKVFAASDYAAINAKSIADSQQAAANEAQNAANAQQQAAEEAQRAAQAAIEAAEELRKMRIEALDKNAPNAVALRLMAGQSARAVNQLIEQGEIQFGTAQQRFETQLDLYKRAGLSNAQIAADIRAGLIGENVEPSKLLAALDSLEEAVNSNTAAQIGLSDFYTQQGDRLLGYRGFNVQTGIRSGTGTLGGVGDTGTGVGGMPGAVATPPAQVAYEVTHPPVPGSSTAQQTIVYNYYYPPPSQQPVPAPGTSSMTPLYLQYQQPSSYVSPLSSLYGQPTSRFAEGGIVDKPTFGLFGEAGPEAVVPLKEGTVPVTVADRSVTAFANAFAAALEQHFPVTSTRNLTRAVDDLVEAIPDVHFPVVTTPGAGVPGVAPDGSVHYPVTTSSGAAYPGIAPDPYGQHFPVIGGHPGATWIPISSKGFAEGGIANYPTMGMVGEAGPEAFVPLRGGAIPVKLTGNNDNKPTTIVNINAPLVHFAAEPTRDEVRESAFQASQMLRRAAFGG